MLSAVDGASGGGSILTLIYVVVGVAGVILVPAVTFLVRSTVRAGNRTAESLERNTLATNALTVSVAQIVERVASIQATQDRHDRDLDYLLRRRKVEP